MALGPLSIVRVLGPCRFCNPSKLANSQPAVFRSVPTWAVALRMTEVPAGACSLECYILPYLCYSRYVTQQLCKGGVKVFGGVWSTLYNKWFTEANKTFCQSLTFVWHFYYRDIAAQLPSS